MSTQETTTPLEEITRWSIVRLSDGRIGYKDRARGHWQIVMLRNGSEVQLDGAEQVTLLATPEIVMEAILSQYAGEIAIKTRAEIAARIRVLYQELEHWQREAEAAILRQDWQCPAANNCTRVRERITALQWVLDGTPMHVLRNE